MQEKFKIERGGDNDLFFGIKNEFGDWVLNPEYDFITGLHDETVWIKEKSKWKRVRLDGTILKEIDDTLEVFNFNNKIAVVKSKEKEGLMDVEGNIVLPIEYDMIANQYYNVAFVKRDNKWSVFEKDTNQIWDLNADDFIDVRPNVYCIRLNDKWYEFVPPYTIVRCLPYDEVDYYDTEDFKYFKFRKGEKYGIIDESFNKICSAKYLELDLYHTGIPAAAKNSKGRYGFVDKTGKKVIPFIYDWANSFFEGVGVVELDDKMGAVNLEGKFVLPIEYDVIVNEFIHLMVEKDGYFWYIDYNGEIIKDMPHDKVENFTKYY